MTGEDVQNLAITFLGVTNLLMLRHADWLHRRIMHIEFPHYPERTLHFWDIRPKE
jgi:hypothetical protein